MAENKTQLTDESVIDFLESVENPVRREDGFRLLKIMEEITGEEPKMWGPAIIGFGKCHYKYESGREGDMPKTGFSPRKQNLTLYLGKGPDYEELLSGLGKFKTSVACLYLNKLSDADEDVLRKLISSGHQYMNEKYG